MQTTRTAAAAINESTPWGWGLKTSIRKGASAGFASATAAIVIVSFSKRPSLQRGSAAIHTSALPQTHKVDALEMPVVARGWNEDTTEFKPPFEGEPPQYQPWEVIRTFAFEGPRRRHPEWNKDTQTLSCRQDRDALHLSLARPAVLLLRRAS